MFHQQLRVLDRTRQRDHSGSEQITRAEFARFLDDVAADHVRDEPAHLLEIANVITCELRIRLGQLSRTHRVITIVKLFRAQEFPGWRGR